MNLELKKVVKERCKYAKLLKVPIEFFFEDIDKDTSNNRYIQLAEDQEKFEHEELDSECDHIHDKELISLIGPRQL